MTVDAGGVWSSARFLRCGDICTGMIRRNVTTTAHRTGRKDELMRNVVELICWTFALIFAAVACFVWFIVSIVSGKPRL